jgi:hypothetical protein
MTGQGARNAAGAGADRAAAQGAVLLRGAAARQQKTRED